VHTAAMKF